MSLPRHSHHDEFLNVMRPVTPPPSSSSLSPSPSPEKGDDDYLSPHLIFSVLDFWGNRQDDIVPLTSLIPPFSNRSISEVKSMVKPVFMPLKVIETDTAGETASAYPLSSTASQGGNRGTGFDASSRLRQRDYYVSLGMGSVKEETILLSILYGTYQATARAPKSDGVGGETS